ncbi:MAG: MmcQ/YjbR family DNA-binding protein [Christensenellales bacterium]|jgi:predicted DNA-binding protein (MmcQ/YjbR family)
MSKILTAREVLEYCLAKKAACEDLPFGPSPVCAKVGGRIFAQLFASEQGAKVTLKCEPELARLFRAQYPLAVARGWHCPPAQQPYWNTVLIPGVPCEVLLGMIDHSYERAVGSLTKRAREALDI